METIITIIISVAGAALALFVIYLILIMPRLRRPDMTAFRVPYAHRGLHDDNIPENSLAAFAAAKDLGGCGIELDVQLSSDGEVMVFHDYSLSRVCGIDRKLSEMTSDELTHTSLCHTEQTIPRFADVLRVIDGKIPILIELKGESTGSVGNLELCKKTTDLLDAYGCGNYCFESFNPLLLSALKKLRPEFVRGILVTDLTREKQKKAALRNFALTALLLNIISKPDFVSFDVNCKLPSVALCTKLFGAEKFVWTVRSKELYDKSLANGKYPIFEKINKQ